MNLLVLVALQASLAVPTPTPTPAEPPEYSLTSGGIAIVTTGERSEYITGRLAVKVPIATRFGSSVTFRGTLTGSQDSGTTDFIDPQLFRSVVGETEYRYGFSRNFDLAFVGNVTFSAEGDNGKPFDARMWSGFLGARGELEDSTWLYGGLGYSGPVGNTFALTLRGGRTIGKGEVFFDYVIPIRADALKNKAWVFAVGSTVTIAKGQIK